METKKQIIENCNKINNNYKNKKISMKKLIKLTEIELNKLENKQLTLKEKTYLKMFKKTIKTYKKVKKILR